MENPLSHDITSGSDITTCNKIDKPLEVYILVSYRNDVDKPLEVYILVM